MKEWFIYICRCSDNTFYTGATTDVDKRIKKHNSGTGARYTKTRRPVTLLYSEKFPSKSEALKREYAIKQLSRKEKEEVISGTSSSENQTPPKLSQESE